MWAWPPELSNKSFLPHFPPEKLVDNSVACGYFSSKGEHQSIPHPTSGTTLSFILRTGMTFRNGAGAQNQKICESQLCHWLTIDLEMDPEYFWKNIHFPVMNLISLISQCWCVDYIFVLCTQSLSRIQLCSPMNCSPPGSSVHGIFQARILEWVSISYSRGSSCRYRLIYKSLSLYCILEMNKWNLKLR